CGFWQHQVRPSFPTRRSSDLETLGLTQVSDADELTRIVDEVIAANPKPVADYKGGKPSAAGRLVGEVMKATRGRANPGVVNELIDRKSTRLNSSQQISTYAVF